ncbi:response regulator [Candidatus Daviesbacteria bacterium]|nr:response regulator [Candidatus Daviesbacteria bacterium]
MNSKGKILLVEDESFISELYQKILTEAGYQVITVIDGEQALKMASSDLNLILLDIMIPKLNGIEVLKKLKSQESTKKIPVVLITNLGSENIINYAFRIGAQGYLMKMRLTPFEILNKVDEFLNNPNYRMEPNTTSYE